MLRARGYDARVTNAGIAGDTTDGMLTRLDSISVPAGTKLVILQPGTNDGKHGSSAGAGVNVPQIVQRLKARGIRVIMANMRSAASDIGPDGQHLTAHGQTVVAQRLLPQVQRLLPQVMSAIGRR